VGGIIKDVCGHSLDMGVMVLMLFFLSVVVVGLEGEALFEDEGAFGVDLYGELVEGLEEVVVGAVDVEMVVIGGSDDSAIRMQLEE